MAPERRTLAQHALVLFMILHRLLCLFKKQKVLYNLSVTIIRQVCSCHFSAGKVSGTLS